MHYLISVVVPLYNKRYSIEGCLRSVLAQTFKPFEIIIVDDGSTDDSSLIVAAIIEEHSNASVKLVSQVNAGVSSARNLGIKLAAGEYVALLDADDEWSNEYLFEMNALIGKCPDASMYSSFHCIADDESNLFVPACSLPEGFAGYVDNYFDLSVSTPLVNSSKVILNKESVLALGGFPVDAVLTEDLFLWFMMASNYRVAFLNKVLVKVNQFADGSRLGRHNKAPFLISYFSKNYCFFRRLEKSKKRYLFSVYYKHFLGSLSDGRYSEAVFRLASGYKLFKLKSFFLMLLLLVPHPFFSFAKKSRRKILSGRNT
ncbi:glycosyltransferase family 2 protein [Pseudomonas sp. IC_126]|uniref:glycosyltransferase family 2 protein n=1 Tax=Pseudomonas sp. IC_126 TaxID=2547400 RepID=UPI00103B31F3|nr:glycosyltransferase family 2 protein [Pseudomonas sp. IC_126]TCD21225.1 glycosyltransferase family 2 protein [Pseudomonas sp. IC_126]